MTRNHEKLLIATLVGVIIAGAAAFAIQPAIASKMDSKANLTGPSHLVLDLRLNA